MSNGIFDPELTGWPDRIWFSANENSKVICKDYKVFEDLRNEHVPVVGNYLVEIENVDSDSKARVVAELLEKEQIGESKSEASMEG